MLFMGGFLFDKFLNQRSAEILVCGGAIPYLSPPIETCRALQQLVMLFMGGFLFDKFLNQQSPEILATMDKFSFAMTSITELVTNDKKNVLYGLGYNVAIYSCMNERPGGLGIVEKKRGQNKLVQRKTA